MEKRKPNFSTKTALCCALLLLTLCVLLVGTITFARYSWEFAQASYQFVPATQRAITVYDKHIVWLVIELTLVDGGNEGD